MIVVTAPAMPATTRINAVSQCQRVASVPATAPDTPTNAICPKLTWPAHPVRTTSDSPITA
jgi:hypothetical protein